MKNSEVLAILERLETFRKKLESGESTGSPDWIVRMCQAHVASGHFGTRMEWTSILNDLSYEKGVM